MIKYLLFVSCNSWISAHYKVDPNSTSMNRELGIALFTMLLYITELQVPCEKSTTPRKHVMKIMFITPIIHLVASTIL